MNTLAYIVYLFITYIITVRVGKLFYKNGRIYIYQLMKADGAITDFINKLLLVGYYLTNLGYATIMLSFWKTIYSITELVATVSTMTGRIILSLAIVHFANLFIIYFIAKKQEASKKPVSNLPP